MVRIALPGRPRHPTPWGRGRGSERVRRILSCVPSSPRCPLLPRASSHRKGAICPIVGFCGAIGEGEGAGETADRLPCSRSASGEECYRRPHAHPPSGMILPGRVWMISLAPPFSWGAFSSEGPVPTSSTGGRGDGSERAQRSHKNGRTRRRPKGGQGPRLSRRARRGRTRRTREGTRSPFERTQPSLKGPARAWPPRSRAWPMMFRWRRAGRSACTLALSGP